MPTPQERIDAIRALAASSGWFGDAIPTSTFTLQTYYPRSLEQSEILDIYIEGDGLAWVTSESASADPTPVNPMAFKLAMKAQKPAVYLARPCQYGVETKPLCERKYWTSHRFSAEVIASVHEALDIIKARFGAKHLNLLGYSGGGAVAAIAAAQRRDVLSLISIAGNLDHQRWTSTLGLIPLSGSLNPVDFVDSLSATPQIHFVGGKDKIIGQFIVQSFIDKFHPRPRLVIVPEFDHRCCWEAYWDKHYKDLPLPPAD